MIETGYPVYARQAAGGDPGGGEAAPLVKWVRWRLLSEPFREKREASGEAPQRG